MIKLTIENTGGWFDEYVVTIGTKVFFAKTAKDVSQVHRMKLAAQVQKMGKLSPDEAKFFVEYANG